MIRASAALIRRRRTRSPARTGDSVEILPLIVTVLPTRPAIAASMLLPKPGAICASGVKRPVGQHPDHVAIYRDGLRLFHDQGARHAAPELLKTVGMRMIPECSRVRWSELVNKLLVWSDWRLGKAWHAIHSVRQANAVPVHRCIFRQLVAHNDAHGLALTYPQLGTGDTLAERPDVSRWKVRADQRCAARRSDQ